MLIAKEKKNSNIAEYILYMWHLEDTFRALNFSDDKVWINISSKFELPNDQKQKIHDWYLAMMEMMKNEHKEKQGHLIYLENTLADFNSFHFTLLQEPTQFDYAQLFAQVKPLLLNLHQNKDVVETKPVFLALEFLYNVLILRIKEKKPVQQDTVNKISAFVKELTIRYHKFENGELSFE